MPAVPGDPQIDVDFEQLCDRLEAVTDKDFDNLTFPLLGRLVAVSMKLGGMATQYYGVKLSQKIGALKSEVRNNAANGI